MSALQISHQQSSSLDTGDVSTGAFNFHPGDSDANKKIFLIGGLALIALFLLIRAKKGK